MTPASDAICFELFHGAKVLVRPVAPKVYGIVGKARVGRRRSRPVLSGEQPARDGVVDRHRHRMRPEERDELGLEPARDGVEYVLGDDGRNEAALVAGGEDVRHLPGRVVADAHVAHLAASHQAGHRVKRLLDIRVVIGGVHVVDVDVVGIQPLQALLHRGKDVAAAETGVVRVLAHLPAHLGGEDDPLAPALERLADDPLAFALHVDIGCVEEIDALSNGVVHDREAVRLAGLFPEHHGAEADARHPKGCSGQFPVFHPSILHFERRASARPTPMTNPYALNSFPATSAPETCFFHQSSTLVGETTP